MAKTAFFKAILDHFYITSKSHRCICPICARFKSLCIAGKHYLRGKRVGSVKTPNRVVSAPKGQVTGVITKVRMRP